MVGDWADKAQGALATVIFISNALSCGAAIWLFNDKKNSNMCVDPRVQSMIVLPTLASAFAAAFVSCVVSGK